jgi:thiamine kinase-like enzyme
MNKIYNLFDQDYVIKLFLKKILPYYPDFVGIKKIEIRSHKKGIWGENQYHVVLEFQTDFIDSEKKINRLPIFCSAHSNEPRKNVYTAMKYLWQHDFNQGNLTIPHPLFYFNEYKASFYRGVVGRTLYDFIRQQEKIVVEDITAKAAQWFVKLHKTPTVGAKNFNKDNSRIATVVPGVKAILQNLEKHQSSYLPIFVKAFKFVIEKERQFIGYHPELSLVHGDAHPENVIRMSNSKIAIIDFTDICLSDFTRDIGSFMQQLRYMTMRKIGDKDFSDKMSNVFLSNYAKYAKIKIDEEIQARIDLYYAWTAMRTAVYFLMKDKPESERVAILIDEFKNKLNI